MINNSVGIIPARLDSTRFPNKLFSKLDNIPILQRVIENILSANVVDKLIIATDSKRVIDFCKSFNVECFYMEDMVSCGSERAYYVYQKYPNYDQYITFPADEPLINPDETKKLFKDYEVKAPVTTCYSDFHSMDRLLDPKSCKIVSNKANQVLYFSRSPIPWSKTGLLDIKEYKKHVGVFIFENEFFTKYKDQWKSDLADKEGLEQIAFIDNNIQVNLMKIEHKYYGIDSPEDIIKIEELMRQK